jgi:hypothetical protein
MVVTVILGVFPSRVAAQSVSTPDYRFGVADSVTDLAIATANHVGWSRVPLFWNRMERRPGRFNVGRLDRLYRRAAAAGEALVGVVEGTPRWADVNPGDGPDGVPRGLDLPWNNPGNTWGQFMYWVARHYAGVINVFIIWDEISIPKGPHRTWNGTIPQFARLLQVAAEAATAANPAARILPPGAPYWYTDGRTTAALLTALGTLPGAHTHLDYIAALDLNLYNTIVFNRLIYNRYQAILRAHGLARLPIWLTETNVAIRTRRNPAGATPAQQATFVAENLAMSLAYASRVEVYKMRDGRDPTRFLYGLVTQGGRPRRAVSAFRTLVTVLDGVRWLRASVYRGDGAYLRLASIARVTFGAPRRLINVLWNQTYVPLVAVLPARARRALLVTLFGQATTIRPVGSVYRIQLKPATYHPPGRTAAVIGGPPVYVIETVPLGADGTPRRLPPDTPDGLPVVPTDRWPPSHHWPRGPRVFLVVVNPAGDQVVIDDHGRVHWIADAGPWPTELNGPVAAAVGPHHTVFIANAGNDDVLVLSPSGRLLRWFGGYPTILGLSGIAIDRAGDVFLTETGRASVDEYTAGGQFVRRFGRAGTAPGRFDGLDGITITPDGTVWVADTLNHRLEAFTTTGRLLNVILVPGDPTTLSWTRVGRHVSLIVHLAFTNARLTLRLPRRA